MLSGNRIARHQGPFRTRASRLRASHDYGLVLGLTVAVIVFAATAPDLSWATGVLALLQAATLVAALWTSGMAGADSKISLLLVAGAIGAVTALFIWGGVDLTAAVLILTGVLTVATVFAIAVGVLDQREVNRQSVRGAFCIYLLLGLVFVFLYGAAALLGSGPFFAQGTDGTRALRVYFSYVTLATLGYGDYTPAGNLGHMLAVTEAILGQLYLVTVLASLVAKLGTKAAE